jgi:hypothetical protein
MKTSQDWKPASRIDTVMNVLLIVLALSVLGVGAFEYEAPATHASAATAHHA